MPAVIACCDGEGDDHVLCQGARDLPSRASAFRSTLARSPHARPTPALTNDFIGRGLVISRAPILAAAMDVSLPFVSEPPSTSHNRHGLGSKPAH